MLLPFIMQIVVMPPRSERSAVVVIKPEELTLACEWQECTSTFKCMNTFTEHINGHLQDLFDSLKSQTQPKGTKRSYVWCFSSFSTFCVSLCRAFPRCYSEILITNALELLLTSANQSPWWIKVICQAGH